MNYVIKTLGLCLVLVLSINLNAQTTSFGARIGINSATINFSDDESVFEIEPDSRIGLNIAAILNVGITEEFSIQPELNFLQKGYKVETDFLGDEIENKITLNYLEVPILAKYAFGSETIQGFVLGGPAVGYAISGKFKTEENGESNEEDVDFEEDGIKRLDFGFDLGGGLGIVTESATIFVDIRYLFGIANIGDEDFNDGSIRNRGLNIAVGALFPL